MNPQNTPAYAVLSIRQIERLLRHTREASRRMYDGKVNKNCCSVLYMDVLDDPQLRSPDSNARQLQNVRVQSFGRSTNL